MDEVVTAPEQRSGDATPVARSWLPFVALPAVVAMAVVPMSRDGRNDIKLLAITMALGLTAWRTMTCQTRREDWRRLGTPGIAAALFLAVAAVATITSDAPMLSLLGALHRHNGLLAYTVAVALFTVVVRAVPRHHLAGCLNALALGAAAAVAYWLLQLAGWDPLGILPEPGKYASTTMFSSTLGNPNFAGAFTAAALPAALWAAGRSGQPDRRRAARLIVVGLLVAGVVGADSVQAPIAAGAGVGILAIARISDRSRRAAAAAAAGGGVLVLMIVVGLMGAGPLARLGRLETFVSRTWDWTAAVRMAGQDPLTGVGLARFGGYVRAHRPPGDIVNYGWQTYADAAHSVPLDMVAGGGIPLLVVYVGFVLAVGWRLVRGLRRLHGERLLLLGAFGGMWTAYQAQSLVSIDVVPLWFLHFLSAGAIVALTAPVVAPPPRSAEPVGGPAPQVRKGAATALALLTALTALAVATHLTANLLWGLSEQRAASGDAAAALDLNAAGLRLFPWDGWAWWHRARLLEDAGNYPGALDAYLAAVAHDRRQVFFLTGAADAARQVGDLPLAARLLRDAVEVEPQAAEVKVMAAIVALDLGDTAHARRLLDAALAFDPANHDARVLREELANRQE